MTQDNKPASGSGSEPIRKLVYDKARRTIVDPRDPDHTRTGMFVLHNCSYCRSGELPCRQGNPRQCEYPHARND